MQLVYDHNGIPRYIDLAFGQATEYMESYDVRSHEMYRCLTTEMSKEETLEELEKSLFSFYSFPYRFVRITQNRVEVLYSVQVPGEAFSKVIGGVAAISVQCTHTGICGIDVYCASISDDYSEVKRTWADDFADFVVNNTSSIEEQSSNSVFMLVLGGNGRIDLGRLPSIGKPVQAQNYDPVTLQDVDSAFNNLLDPDPFGRLLILTGEPGTGKTYLIRHLINTKRPARFIFLPPNYVSEFSGPEVIGRILQLNESLKAHTSVGDERNDPLILIVEDADTCLVKRGMDNMSEVSNLLNLTSGLTADAFNIRVLATANTPIKDMDPAIRRPGRLHKTIELDKLSYEQALAVVRREVDKRFPGKAEHIIGGKRFSGSRTLAEAYEMAEELCEGA